MNKILFAACTLLISTPLFAQKIEHQSFGNQERETAPDFTLKDIYGKKVTLSNYQGKAVLLYFWRTNSRLAPQAISNMLAMQKEFAGKLQCIAVAFDTSGLKTIKPRSEELGILFPSLIGNKKLLETYRMNNQTGWFFLITKKGKIFTTHNEAEDRSKLERWVYIVSSEE